jgi:hypothetical protein
MDADAVRTEYEVQDQHSQGRYSGRFVVHVPRSLHRRLAEMAAREGVPVNVLVNIALVDFVSRPMDEVMHTESPAGQSPGIFQGLGRVFGGGRKRATPSPPSARQRSREEPLEGKQNDRGGEQSSTQSGKTRVAIDENEQAVVETAAERESYVSKYAPLRRFLEMVPLSESVKSLTFSQVEGIIGSRLPRSARAHRPWWANTRSHVQADAWLDAGWKVDSASLRGETVMFKRET